MIILIRGDIFSANLSALESAKVFGISSPKINIINVIIIVAYKIPSVSVISINIFVARADAKTFTKLLAKRIVQINCSLSLKIFSKTPAFFLPDRARMCILGFDADVNDVSEPEKKADKKTNPIIDPIRIDRGKSISLS